MKSFLLIITAMALLAACTTPEEKCSGYGFTPGTDDFAACNMYVSEQKAQARRNALQGLARGLSAAGQQYSQSSQPVQTFQPRPSQFSTYRIGNKTWQCQTMGNNVTCR